MNAEAPGRGAARLIIFDIDGTLFQTDRVTVPAVQRAFASYGLPQPSAELVCSFFGKPVEDYEAWLAAQCPPDRATEIVEATNALELELIGAEGRLYPGARETLETLQNDGYELAICSNGPEPYVREFLRAHDLVPFFSEVRARGIRYADKEEMVGLILDRIHPERFAVVGDRQEDLEAAHLHQGFGIAAVYGFGHPAEWTTADACIQTIAETPACVRQLFGP